MTDRFVASASQVLRRHGVRFVVVGGRALARSFPAATDDVDVMVAASEYSTAVQRLKTDRRLRFESVSSDVSRFWLSPGDGQPFPTDVLDTTSFSGRRPGSAFFEYLVGGGSFEEDGVLYARPATVVYTRLMSPRWASVYVKKLATDVGNGMSIADLNESAIVARQFGVPARIEERLSHVFAEIRRRGLDRPVRWTADSTLHRE